MTEQEMHRRRSSHGFGKGSSIHQPHPTRLADALDDRNDADVDVAVPKGINPRYYMNQSIFSVFAAAGSKADLRSRFDEDTSEGEDDSGTETVKNSRELKAEEGRGPHPTSSSRLSKHKRAISESKLMQSFSRLRLKPSLKKPLETINDRASPEEPSSAHASIIESSPHDVPVMSRMIQAQAQWDVTDSKVTDCEADTSIKHDARPTSISLPDKLKEIFGFDEPEEVVSEYPSWLMKSVLLQGYMYITRNHVCFYAYLPKKSNVVVKSGYLSKRGRQNPKYNRYWFVLKGDVLSYYASPSNLYFPAGNVDLRYGISATLADPKGKESGFVVVTDQRTYHFKADSTASAKEWVKVLQKVIFRTQNDGDSVKISLPIENIIDMEESPVIDSAETFKIRVIEDGESYAIDEYFFSFFGFGKDAFNTLKTVIDDAFAEKLAEDEYLSPTRGDSGNEPSDNDKERQSFDNDRRSLAPVMHYRVRATLSPKSPVSGSRASPLSSSDRHCHSIDAIRNSFDASASRERGRRQDAGGRSHSRHGSQRHQKRSSWSPWRKHNDSLDSYVNALEQQTESSAAIQSITDTQGSASQILNRSDVFDSPTIRMRERRFKHRDSVRSHSEDIVRPNFATADIRVIPPSRTSTRIDFLESKRNDSSEPTFDLESDTLSENDPLPHSSSSPALQELVKAGKYPLQGASYLAGYLKSRSKKMSNLLAAESMGYIEKVSGMWAGNRQHYGDTEGVMTEDGLTDPDDEDGSVKHGDRFRMHFALPQTERLEATYYGYLNRVLPLYGKIYISSRKMCFRSLLPGTRTKMILPLKDIETVTKEKGFRFGYSGLVVVIRGHEELFFEFRGSEDRDDCTVTLLQSIDTVKFMKESGLLNKEQEEEAEAARAEHQYLREARQFEQSNMSFENDGSAASSEAPPVLFDDVKASIITFRPTQSLNITCLTIGSRGDVQPYIALCKGLMADGHRCKIATHAEFGPWIQSHGIDFAPVAGDPAELMRICVDNGMFTYSFLREATSTFRGWLDGLLSSAWEGCRDSDILIESPSAMAGIHIAEALQIPYFRAFGMPWTRTRAYPHAFAVPDRKMGGAYNWFSYVMFDAVFWKGIAWQVNRWRKKELNLPSTSLDRLKPNKVPFLYNFSPSVVPPPIDYPDWTHVTGYWFLDEGKDFEPPRDLVRFIQKARIDNKKIVYIGFGSIVVPDASAITQVVVDSVAKADIRCILSKGWSDRLNKKDASAPEIVLPPEIYPIKSVPHDWLFKLVDAAVHHGGAGTTGASLRAGLPTIIYPFFGDQFFFASRVEDLGVGIYMHKLNTVQLSRALWEATRAERIIVNAKILGEQIRRENGVETAIQDIYRDLEYAKTLIKKRALSLHRSDSPPTTPTAQAPEPPIPAPDDDDEGESWTFVGNDENDAGLDLGRRITQHEQMMERNEKLTSRLLNAFRGGMGGIGGSSVSVGSGS